MGSSKDSMKELSRGQAGCFSPEQLVILLEMRKTRQPRVRKSWKIRMGEKT